MKPIPLHELASIFGGQLSARDSNVFVSGFATDSQAVQPGDLFLAIRGARVDGADFAADAVSRGAVAALSERTLGVPHILTTDLVASLASLGRHFRDRFDGPVVGITGSAGKTTTKEFMAAALGSLGPVVKSAGNRNTEYTSPLTWAEVSDETSAVVIEMAMRGFGQIAHLASFTRPTVGVVTNIGYAHLLQVGSRQGIAEAKSELLEALPKDGLGILWQGDLFLDFLTSRAPGCQIRTFGYTDQAHCRILSYRPLDWEHAVISGTVAGHHWECRLPAVGRHIALNAAAAILTAFELGVDVQDAAHRIESVQLPPLRMETQKINGATMLLDTYNASPPSMIAAIETLTELPVDGRRMAVIGEMKELGDYSEEAHQMVGRALATHGVDEIIFFGEGTEAAWNEFLRAGGSATVFRIAESLSDVTAFLQTTTTGDVVLIKGSRALELERALLPLEAKP